LACEKEGTVRLDWLADVHRDAGLAVVEHTGWATRTLRPFDEYHPVGLLNHHTAGYKVLTAYPGPPYYSNTSLQDKCNITIRGDGTVVVLNAGWAKDSGYGDRRVLAAVRAGQPAPAPTDTYSSLDPVTPGGANPGVGGNAWFIDNEVQHLGNGTYIAGAQRDALIRSNAAVLAHLGWDPATRLIGHREWTTRKVDPRWGGFANPMPQIRQDTLLAKDDDMTPEEARTVMREELDRRIDGKPGAVNGFQGVGQGVGLNPVGRSGLNVVGMLQRVYTNVGVLLTAHNAGKLGTTATAVLTGVDDAVLEAIAEAVADEQAARLQE
jgi:hypothetical protein